jgi:hypothetical protein
MSVSDDSNRDPNAPRDWRLIRHEYESGSIGYRKLAKKLGIPEQTMSDRMRREKWVQAKKLVRKAALDVSARLNNAVSAKIEAELAPYIEAEKVKFTKQGIKIAKSGMSRVKRMFKSQIKHDPKNEAFISKTAETYHRIGRVALGMTDGTAPVMPLNLAILGNHTAVQIVRQGPESESQD